MSGNLFCENCGHDQSEHRTNEVRHQGSRVFRFFCRAWVDEGDTCFCPEFVPERAEAPEEVAS